MESGNAQQFMKSAQSYATTLEAGRGQLQTLGREFNTDRLTKKQG